VPRPQGDLVLHPVRLRIVQAIGAGELTTAALAAKLPDVPQATLYRHVARLVEGGLLEAATERRIRGATERTYRLAAGGADALPPGAAIEDHMAAFTRFAGGLVADYARYAANPEADPANDGAGFRQVTLWLNDEEFAEFARGFGEVLQKAAAHKPGGSRQPITLSTVLIPATAPSG
jgi:DNA-binding transcriptional ArsR family regulator